MEGSKQDPQALLNHLIQKCGVTPTREDYQTLRGEQAVFGHRIDCAPLLGLPQGSPPVWCSGTGTTKREARFAAAGEVIRMLKANSRDPHLIRWAERLPKLLDESLPNPKGWLIEQFAQLGLQKPKWLTEHSHLDGLFNSSVDISTLLNLPPGTLLGSGTGGNKKDAQQKAALQACHALWQYMQGTGVISQPSNKPPPQASGNASDKGAASPSKEVPSMKEEKQHPKKKEKQRQSKEKEKEKEKGGEPAEQGEAEPTLPPLLDDAIMPEDLRTIRELGKGNYGQVWAGIWIRSATEAVEVAIKDVNDTQELETSRHIMTLPPHPNVVRLYGLTSEPKPRLVAELGGCDLVSFMRQGQLNLRDHCLMRRILSGVVAGMIHLHKNRIMHKDLAARNVLIDRDHNVKICDLGLARPFGDEANEYKVIRPHPFRCLPPETFLLDNIYEARSDVWMFGCLCWELWAGSKPHSDLNEAELRERAKTQRLQLDFDALYLLDVKGLAALLKRCQAHDLKDRPSFETIQEELPILDW